MVEKPSLPPGNSEGNMSLSGGENRYVGDAHRPQNIDEGYIDTEYRSVPQEEMGLGEYLGIILRRKRTILVVFLVVFIAAGLYTFTTPPVYRSMTTLEVEKETGASLTNLGDALTQGLGGGTENEVFATQISIIKDRSIAEAIINKMNLAASPEFNKEPGFISKGLSYVKNEISSWFNDDLGAPDPDAVLDKLVKDVQDRVSAKRDAQSRLILVGFEAGSPAMAKDLLQNLTEIYLNQNLDKRRRVQREASLWLNEEIERAEAKVLKSLAALVSFTSKHGVVSIDDSANHILTFFNKAAEGLVKTKEQRMNIEALQKDGRANASAIMTGVKGPDIEQLHNKLSLLEAEHAQMTEIYSESYPKVVLLRKQIQFLKDRIEETQNKAVSSVVETAKQQENLSEEAFEKAKQMAMDSKSMGVEYAILKREAETNETIFKTLLTKSKELQLSTEVIGNNILTVVKPNLPVVPVKPRKALNMAIGAMLGMILGIGAAFLQERLDSSVYDSRDLEKMRITSLGMIPNYSHIRKLEGDRETDSNLPLELIAALDPTSAVSEAFSIVRTSLLLTTSYTNTRVLHFVSAIPGEGKSFNCVSLAALMANYGKRVLIVEADMRKPRLSKLFESKRDDPGLSTLLTFDKIKIEKCIRELQVPGLFFLGAGPRPKDPARLLDNGRLADLIEELKGMFDIIMVDSPPVTGMPDARIISKFVEGIVLVVRQGHASSDVIRSAAAALSRHRPGLILGAIFNNVGVSSSKYGGYGKYGYGYGYGYSHYSKYGYSSYYRTKEDKKLDQV